MHSMLKTLSIETRKNTKQTDKVKRTQGINRIIE